MQHYTSTIKARMSELGIGQRKLAHHTALSVATVNTVINNPETANMASVLKVLGHLGLTLYVFPEKGTP